MDWNKCPLPHPQVAARIVDGSAVIVLADSGEVMVLNAVGSRIWQLVDGEHTLNDIANSIHAEYTVSLDEARADVETFIQKLIRAHALSLGE